MKTKIIYISGSEIFNMTDVRNAFDTVRRELQLPKDTILFGVPVDADDALGSQFESNVEQTVETEPVDVQPVDVHPAVEEVVTVAEPEKPKRTRKKTVKAVEIEDDAKTETVVEPTPEKEVIPILSVLGGDDTKKDVIDIKADDTLNDDMMEDNTDLVSAKEDAEPIVNISDLSSKTEDAEPEFFIEPDTITPDIKDEIPVLEPEPATVQVTDDDDDQLAKLLESVQSLHEDKEEDTETELKVIESEPDETDATLEKLANEFAENQDKIVNTTKSTARGGRIGKLKNILPFKKSKHNESSLMGDLFGWAGVAANDEEFGIPEFFPTAVKK